MRGCRTLSACLLCWCMIQAGLAQEEQPEEERLQAQVLGCLDRAGDLYSGMGEVGAATEEAAAARERLLMELESARESLHLLEEGYPDLQDWVETELVKLESMAFWVKRLTPVELEPPGEAPVEEAPPLPTYSLEDLPAGVRPRLFDTVEEARGAARRAREEGRLAEAFYHLLELLQYHPKVDGEIRQEVERLRLETDPEELVVYLVTELRGEDPVRRLFAVRELGLLGLKSSIEPLVEALQEETVPEVRREIPPALGRTPRHETARQLERLSRSQDRATKLLAIQTLGHEVGGRYGASALVTYAGDRDPQVWEPAVFAAEDLGGDRGAATLGAMARSRRAHPKLIFTILEALARLGTTSAAQQVCPLLSQRGDYRYAASDCLVAMGGAAVPALIDSLTQARLRVEATGCLQRISGITMGASPEKWSDWYRRWLDRGEPSLPCHPRGWEPERQR